MAASGAAAGAPAAPAPPQRMAASRGGAKRRRVEACEGSAEAPLGRARALLAWLRSAHGADVAAGGLEVRRSSTGGLGMFAARRLRPGEALARIPAAAALHAGRAAGTAFGRRVLAALAGPGVEVAPEELLWLYMVWGRGEAEACPWFAYLRALPDQDPLRWSTDEAALRWLEGTPLLGRSRREVERQRERHALVVGALSAADPVAFPPPRFAFDKWLWARSCYLSRGFRHQAFPSECVDAAWASDLMVPVLDMFNHRRDARVEWQFGTASASFLLPSDAAAYEAGDEVFNFYGADLGNEDLLAHYGFAERRNPHDAVQEVTFALPPGELQQRLAAGAAVGAAAAGAAGARVRLAQPLRRATPETPGELLRAAALLSLRCDYDPEAATCSDRAGASRAAAAALRGMLRQTAPLLAQAVRSRRRRQRCRRGHYRWMRRAQAEAAVLPRGATQRAAATYAAGQRRLLRSAAARAEGEAELAELAQQLDEDGGAGDEGGSAGDEASASPEAAAAEE